MDKKLMESISFFNVLHENGITLTIKPDDFKEGRLLIELDNKDNYHMRQLIPMRRHRSDFAADDVVILNSIINEFLGGYKEAKSKKKDNIHILVHFARNHDLMCFEGDIHRELNKLNEDGHSLHLILSETSSHRRIVINDHIFIDFYSGDPFKARGLKPDYFISDDVFAIRYVLGRCDCEYLPNIKHLIDVIKKEV